MFFRPEIGKEVPEIVAGTPFHGIAHGIRIDVRDVYRMVGFRDSTAAAISLLAIASSRL